MRLHALQSKGSDFEADSAVDNCVATCSNELEATLYCGHK